SYCRDLIDTSRLLDLYALLGVPLHVTLGYPSNSGADPQASAGLAVAAGYCVGIDAAAQARWTSDVAELAICKPFVRGVRWAHLTDAAPHVFPHCGLVDASGQVKPALTPLGELRRKHLM